MKVKLETFLKEISEKTTCNNQYPVLTSSKSGLYLQSDYFNKQVASKDNTGYKIIRRGQFTYRAMSDTGEFFPNLLECTDVGIVSPAYPVFEITQPDAVAPEYLKYFFKSDSFQYSISSFAQGSTRTSIKFGKLKTVDINLPSIERQREIVFILDKASKLLELRKEELAKLDELIKARFVEMFGNESNPYQWPVISVEEVANVSVGVVIKPAQYYTDAEHGVKAFRSLNIGPMTIKDGDWVYFSYEGNDKNAKSQLKENDLLIVRSGAPGTACVVPKQYEGCNAIDIIIARPNTGKINPYYLCTYTNMPNGKRQIEEGTGGAAQQHFNVGKYNKLRLMMPPLELQNEFVNFIAQVDKSKVAVQKSLDETQELFDSLMQDYFG